MFTAEMGTNAYKWKRNGQTIAEAKEFADGNQQDGDRKVRGEG